MEKLYMDTMRRISDVDRNTKKKRRDLSEKIMSSVVHEELRPARKIIRPGERIRIVLKAYDSNILNEACTKILDVVKRPDSKTVGPVPLPTKRRIYCVLRSPHVNKDSRDHFEIRTHKRLIELYDPEPERLDNLRNIDLPAGIDVTIKRYPKLVKFRKLQLDIIGRNE